MMKESANDEVYDVRCTSVRRVVPIESALAICRVSIMGWVNG